MRSAATISVVVLMLAGWAFWSLYGPTTTQKELNRIAETGRAEAWSDYDLVCFNSNNGSERDDFSRAAKRAGGDIDKSLASCGLAGSCCLDVLDSDYSGLIGYVRDGQIRCERIRFGYVLDGAREACIKPENLHVTRTVFESRYFAHGRPWVGEPGYQYYKIAERRR